MNLILIFRLIGSIIYANKFYQDNAEERIRIVTFLTENYSKEWILGEKTNVMGMNKCKGTYSTYTLTKTSLSISGCNNNQPRMPQSYAWTIEFDEQQKEWHLLFNNKNYRFITSESKKIKRQKLILLAVRTKASDVIEKIELFHSID